MSNILLSHANHATDINETQTVDNSETFENVVNHGKHNVNYNFIILYRKENSVEFRTEKETYAFIAKAHFSFIYVMCSFVDPLISDKIRGKINQIIVFMYMFESMYI